MSYTYSDIWTCTNCNYTSTSIYLPFKVEPKSGIPKAIIEYRWCNDCKEIQRTFTGKGAPVIPGEEPYSPIYIWEFNNIEEFEKEIQKIEKKKKNNIFFFLTKDAKKLRKYYKSKTLCEKYTLENIIFYNNLNSIPKCLICGGTNVSKVPFEQDKHSCGGEFIRKDSRSIGRMSQVEVITYTSDGTPTSEMRKNFG